MAISGQQFVKSLTISDVVSNKEEQITTDGIFIEVGHVVDNHLAANLVKLNDRKEIIIDLDCKTSESGVFAAGDNTSTESKQIVIAAGEGAKAALSAYKYLQSKKGQKSLSVDWTH